MQRGQLNCCFESTEIINTKQSYLASLLLAVCLSDNLMANSIQDSKDIGGSFANSMQNSYKSGFSQKVSSPMTTDATITTYDGTKSGNAKLLCSGTSSSSYPFATISYNGSDNVTVDVKLDTNSDGTIDKINSFSGISGIHASGVIKCSSAFTGCTYYDWTYSASTKDLLLTTTANKSGAYCINNSCGEISATQYMRILGDITGSIIGAIQGGNGIIITKTIEGTSNKVFTNDYSNCSASNSGSYDTSSGIPNSSTVNSLSSSQNKDNNYGSFILEGTLQNESKNKVNQSDLSDMKEVVKSTSTARYSSSEPNQIEYNSKIKDENGNWVTSSQSAQVIGTDVVQKRSCMVQWNETYTPVISDNTVKGVGSGNGVSQTEKTELRECTGAGNDICPTSSGETVRYACDKMNNQLGEAASAISTMKEIGEDMSCSN